MKIRDERGAVMLESTYCILISIIVLMLKQQSPMAIQFVWQMKILNLGFIN